jgi:serine/threonine-protein kinase
VAVLVQALRGLVYAHEKRAADGSLLRVVHCDISPGNIVCSWGGTAKIVDFGIARATIQLRAEDHSVAGKYNYMAPEQIRGEPIDARADLFALGVILYELTVGKRLFRGRPEQVMRLVLEEPIEKPSAVRPDYPLPLEAIVMKSLERDPQRRYATARQLRDDLKRWLAAEGGPHGKRELALYLRSIFDAAKKHDADEFGVEEEEEELVLEKALPRLPGDERALEVDPEDPDDEAPVADAAAPAAETLAPTSSTESPTPTPSTESLAATEAPAPAPDNAETAPRPRLPAPRTQRPWIPIAAGAAITVAVAQYFLFGR